MDRSLLVSDGLVDPRTGLIRRLARQAFHPNLPEALHCVIASVAGTGYLSPALCDSSAAGCAWWDEGAACAAAVGEAVERYCSDLVPSDLRRASHRELCSAGEKALDPEQLALFAPAQYEDPGFPFVPFTCDLRVPWVSGIEMAALQRVLVPASLVYPPHTTGEPTESGRFTNPMMNSGTAAGRSRGAAEFAAILELLEHDAVALGWLSNACLPSVTVPGGWRALLRGPAGVLETTLYQFPSEFGFPVVGAVVRDPTTGVLAMGTACRPDPLEAALKAVAESCQLHMTAAELDNPSSLLLRRAAVAASTPLKSWRADRRYRQDYRDDWHDVVDLACHVQLYLDPEMQRLLDDRLAHSAEVPLRALPSVGSRSSADLVSELRRRGVSVVAVDITTSDVRSLGWHVVHVIAPGLYTNTPAAFPLLGGPRLAAILGGEPPRDLSVLPMP